MTEFIIISFFMSIFGGFFGLMVYYNMETSKRWKKWLATILVSVLFGVTFTGGFFLDEKFDLEAWNDGKCACGNEWKFESATRRRSTTYYHWYCEDCQKVIEITRCFN